MRILCTNDDGYLATGLAGLTDAARAAGRRAVVAPGSGAERDQPLAHHASSRCAPDRSTTARPRGRHAHRLRGAGGGGAAAGPPGRRLSGVNHGPNMGEDVLYSGTVAGAMEATILGIPAVAVSYVGARPERHPGVRPAARPRCFRQLVKRGRVPGRDAAQRQPARQSTRRRCAGCGSRGWGGASTPTPSRRPQDPNGRSTSGSAAAACSGRGERRHRLPGGGGGLHLGDARCTSTSRNYRLLSDVEQWELARERPVRRPSGAG